MLIPFNSKADQVPNFEQKKKKSKSDIT